MSRRDTFNFDDLSVRQETNIRAIAEASKVEPEELIELAKKAANRGRRSYLEALAYVYELSAKAMSDWHVRQGLKLKMQDLKEWKTSAKLTNCLARNLMKVSRQMASKYSAVIDYAFTRKVNPEDFVAFVKKGGGIEKMYSRVAQGRKVSDQSSHLEGQDASSAAEEVSLEEEAGDRSASVSGKRKSAKSTDRTDTQSASVGASRSETALKTAEREGDDGRSDDRTEGSSDIDFAALQLSRQSDNWMRDLCIALSGRLRDAKADNEPKLLTVLFEVSDSGQIACQGYVLGGLD